MKRVRSFTISVLLLLGAWVVGAPLPAHATTTGTDAWGLHWLSEITDETIQAEYGGKDAGKLGPYLRQLATVRKAALAGDRDQISSGMVRFLDMLQSRENGISSETAVRLFDIAYEVVPARYVNSQRFEQQYRADIKPYMDRFNRDVGGSGIMTDSR